MRTAVKTITVLLVLLLAVSAQASWWGGGEQQNLNLDSGYDANTVTTASGRVTAITIDEAQPQARFSMEVADGVIVVVLGPRKYWSENGIALKIGDRVTVRGSKAQGKDGVVYLLAQWLSEEGSGNEVALRNEAGRPYWAGNGAGNRFGRNGGHSGPRQHSPGRLGGRTGR